ncbi:MAG: hypothetical protein JOY59_03725, partial [Candidatus Eremiobacteraeota bacterium]|nr:hypothetical protein [Candidatus Eremiobacteraeota bacterium]
MHDRGRRLSAAEKLEDQLLWLTENGLDACELDDRATLRRTAVDLARKVPNHSAVLAASGGLARVDGDVERAIRLYRRALEHNPPPKLRADVLEELIAIEGSRENFLQVETLLAIAIADHPDHLGLRSLRALLRAGRNEPSARDDIEDILESSPDL